MIFSICLFQAYEGVEHLPTEEAGQAGQATFIGFEPGARALNASRSVAATVLVPR